ncbi:major facilitator superfamily domain-containing protein [Usnea florida]
MSDSLSAEKRAHVGTELNSHGLQLGRDDFVEWKLDEKQHPRNWNLGKKVFNVGLVCFFEFWMTAISSAGTAASDSGRKDYDISRTMGYFVFTSLYLLGQAIGSIFCSPVSETFGRRTQYIVAIAVYCIFSAVTAAVPSPIAVGFGRFVTGFASAIPATVAFGSFEDLYDSETRIWIVYIYTLTGNMGLVLGPIYSAYVTAYAGWRWVFYVSTIVSGVGIGASWFLHESRTGYLLEMKVAAIQGTVGDKSLRVPGKHHFTLRSFAQDFLLRPLEFLVTQPIIFCCAVLMTVSYSLIYGLTEGLTVVYTEFGFAESTTSSLSFIPILLGLSINVLPRIYDQRRFTRCRRQNVPLRPETKIKSLITSCPALAIGLWLFAWTIPPRVPHVHWIVSMIGLVFVGYATNDLAYVLFGYLTDSYGPYAASACAALSLSRTLMGAIFPLFTYTMYTGLGGNVATSVFAAIATVFCMTPVVFIKYGRTLRNMSHFAQSDEDGDHKDEETVLDQSHEANQNN